MAGRNDRNRDCVHGRRHSTACDGPLPVSVLNPPRNLRSELSIPTITIMISGNSRTARQGESTRPTSTMGAIGTGGTVATRHLLNHRHFLTSTPSNSTLVEFSKILEAGFHSMSPALTESNGSQAIARNANLNDIWRVLEVQLFKAVKIVFSYARQLPGFHNHTLERQVNVIQKGTVPFMAVALSQTWDFNSNKFRWLSLSFEDMEKIVVHFRPFGSYLPQLKKLSGAIKQLDLDHTELSLLCALFLQDLANDYQYKELIVDCIIWYSKNKRPHCRARHLRILNFFRYLFDFYLEHEKIMTEFYTNPSFSNFRSPTIPLEQVLDT